MATLESTGTWQVAGWWLGGVAGMERDKQDSLPQSPQKQDSPPPERGNWEQML
jgi:hypothetical protein